MSIATARLFVALELPSAVREALRTWSQPVLTASGDALRPMASESLHVTLCFLGSLPEAAIPAVGEVCQSMGDSPAAALELREALWLPLRHPRLLAVGLRDDDGALTALQRKLSRALAAAAWYEPETRPFLPHVTVARLRRGVSGSLPLLPVTPEASVEGSLLALMRSRPGPAGARYERLRSVTLVSGAGNDAIASRAAVRSAGRRRTS